MSDRLLSPPVYRLSNGPYPERADVNESAFDRWLSAAYARWFMSNRWFIVGAERFVDRVESHAPEFSRASDAELTVAVNRLSVALRRQGLREKLVAEAFAVIRELSSRILNKRHYRVQIMGGLAMISGRIAEMDTGEGKTLAATLPAGAAAMAGIPTHILTVNEYLATRDAEEMGPLFQALGCSVGVVREGQSTQERRSAYAADITYCTNKDVGFDYLRDRIALKEWPSVARMKVVNRVNGRDGSSELILRGLHFGILDEADSILIDEARTPLIISGQQDGAENHEALRQALEIAKTLNLGEDFRILPEDRRVLLTGRGRAKSLSEEGGLPSAAGPEAGRADLIVQALTALHLYERDKHYIVNDGAVQIVDEFTGRVMPDRTWEMGLHQLIEVKEDCELTGRRDTLAKITYQRLFRRYLHLSGMTGTAGEVADELWSVYRLKVAKIPPNRPRRQRPLRPSIWPSRTEKWRGVIEAVREHGLKQGRPVLIGTRSVEASEELSQLLAEAGIEHQVLNARQDFDEAQLVAQAGRPGVVTVATNMAGRGTDIKLGEGVAERGGLHVILTEYHESGRIDRQLFGRSGRQGDPGSFQSIVAADDELFRIFLPRWARAIPEAELQQSWVNLLWRRLAQSRAERHHAAIRKQTLETDQQIDRMLSFAGRE